MPEEIRRPEPHVPQQRIQRDRGRVQETVITDEDLAVSFVNLVVPIRAERLATLGLALLELIPLVRMVEVRKVRGQETPVRKDLRRGQFLEQLAGRIFELDVGAPPVLLVGPAMRAPGHEILVEALPHGPHDRQELGPDQRVQLVACEERAVDEIVEAVARAFLGKQHQEVVGDEACLEKARRERFRFEKEDEVLRAKPAEVELLLDERRPAQDDGGPLAAIGILQATHVRLDCQPARGRATRARPTAPSRCRARHRPCRRCWQEAARSASRRDRVREAAR